MSGEEVIGAPQEETRLETDRVVIFFVDGQRYAFPIERVREIQQIVELTDVSGGYSGVVGMINLRGTVISVLDLRVMIGLPKAEYRLETPMVICEAHGRLAAVIVEEVDDVLDVPMGILQPAPPLHPLASKMLGILDSNGLVHVLDAELLLASHLEAIR